MNKGLIITIAVIALIGGAAVWALFGGSSVSETDNAKKSAVKGEQTQTTADSLTFAKVTADLAAGAKLYDVRAADEYAGGHFAGADNFPVQDIAAGKLPETDKSAKLYIYCRSGNRSAQAAALLKNAGYTDVIDLHGLAQVESIGGNLTQ